MYWLCRLGSAGSALPPKIAEGVSPPAPPPRSGRRARGAEVEAARLPLEGEGADDEVHRDLFVVTPVGGEDLGAAVLGGVPDDAHAGREVLLEIDRDVALGIDDLLAVPA